MLWPKKRCPLCRRLLRSYPTRYFSKGEMEGDMAFALEDELERDWRITCIGSSLSDEVFDLSWRPGGKLRNKEYLLCWSNFRRSTEREIEIRHSLQPVG